MNLLDSSQKGSVNSRVMCTGGLGLGLWTLFVRRVALAIIWEILFVLRGMFLYLFSKLLYVIERHSKDPNWICGKTKEPGKEKQGLGQKQDTISAQQKWNEVPDSPLESRDKQKNIYETSLERQKPYRKAGA